MSRPECKLVQLGIIRKVSGNGHRDRGGTNKRTASGDACAVTKRKHHYLRQSSSPTFPSQQHHVVLKRFRSCRYKNSIRIRRNLLDSARAEEEPIRTLRGASFQTHCS